MLSTNCEKSYLPKAAPRIEAAVNNYDFGNALNALDHWQETKK